MDRLRSACQDLTADKITVRKKAMESVSDLLSNCLLLNELRSRADGFVNLYDCVVQTVVKEALRCNDKSGVRGVRDAVALLKLVFSKANASSSFRLDANRVVDDLLNLLSDVRLRAPLAADALHLLLEHVLNREQCLAAIASLNLQRDGEGARNSRWTRMFNTVLSLFTTARVPQGLSFLSLLHCLHRMLHSMNIYTGLLTPSLLASRTELMKQIVTERFVSSSTDERRAILKASSLFTSLIAVECRGSLCEMGEACLPVLLNESANDHRLSKELYEWVTLQLSLHHPRGVITTGEGACFHDEAHWRHMLLRSYVELVDVNLNEMTKSNGNGSNNDDDLFLDMATRIAFQVYSHKDANDVSINIRTQHGLSQQWSRSGPKRRRMSVTFEDHLARLSEGWEAKGKQEEALPWIKLLNSLFNTYPRYIQDDERRKLLSLRALAQALKECKLSSVRKCLFECCSSLIRPCIETRSSSSTELDQYMETIASHCVSAIQWRSTSFDVAHDLLRTFLSLKMNRCFIDTQIVFKTCLKREQSQDQLDQSLKTLVILMQVCGIPRRVAYHVDGQSVLGQSGSTQDLANLTVLHWLNSCLERHSSQDEQMTSFWMVGDKEDVGAHNVALNKVKRERPDLLSHFYHLLMAKSASHATNIQLDVIQRQEKDSDLDSLLLNGSLMRLPSADPCKSKVAGNVYSESTTKAGVRTKVAAEVREMIVSQSAQLLHQLKLSTAPDVQFERFQDALFEIVFLLFFLNLQLEFGLLPLDEVFDNDNPNQKIYNCVKSLTAACSEILKKRYLGCLHSLEKSAFFFTWIEKTFRDERLSPVIRALLFHVLAVDSLVHQSLSVHMVRLEGCREGSSQMPKKDSGVKSRSKRMQLEVNDDLDFEDSVNTTSGSNLTLVKSVTFFDGESDKETISADTHYVHSMAIALRGASLLCCPPFNVVETDNRESLQSLKETLGSLFETTLQQELSEKERSVLQNSIFDAFEIIAKAKNALQDKPAFLNGFLRRLPQCWFPKSNFRPHVVVRTLELLILLMADRQEKSNVDNEMIEMLLMGFLHLQVKSDYQRLSVEIQIRIVKLLASFPSDATWPTRFFNICCRGLRELELDESESEEPSIISSLLPFLASSPFLAIRMEASKALSEVFRSPNLSVNAVKDLLGRCKCYLKYMMENDEESKPECACITLALLIRDNRNLVRRLVTQLLLLATHVENPQRRLEVTRRALSICLGSQSKMKSFLESILSWLLNSFLKEKASLNSFPISLFECNDLKSFLMKYENIVIPQCFWSEPSQAVFNELSGLMGNRSRKAMIADNFAHIVSLYLPLTVSKVEHVGKTATLNSTKARTMDATVLILLGQDLFNRFLNENISQVLAEVFALVRIDKSILTGMDIAESHVDDDSGFDYEYEAATVTAFLSALQNMLVPKDCSLFTYLSSQLERRDVLQLILSRLLSPLQSEDSESRDKFKALLSLQLLLQCLQGMEMKSEHFTTCQLPFLVLYTSRVVLSVIKSEQGVPMRQLGCRLLLKLIKMASYSGHGACDQSLLRVHSSMVTLILTGVEIGGECIKVMQHLYVMHPDLNWPQLPLDHEAFDVLKGTQPVGNTKRGSRAQKTELEHCIKNVISSPINDEVYPHLRSLHAQLGGCVESLSLMQQELMSGQGFSEDAISSLLHELITHLMRVIKCCKRPTSDLALRCLAHLGPINLGTQALEVHQVTVATDPSRPISSYIPLLTNHLLSNIGLESSLSNASTLALKALHACHDQGNCQVLLEPFKVQIEVGIDDLKLINDINDGEDWSINSPLARGKSSEWVTNVTLRLLHLIDPDSKHLYCKLVTIASLDERFCEILLPQLVHDLIIKGSAQVKERLCKAINKFFSDFFSKSNEHDNECNNREVKSIIQVMLNIVEHLRRQFPMSKPVENKPTSMSKWSNNFGMVTNINYLHVAKAALHCSAFFSAIMYTELWCQNVRNSYSEVDVQVSRNGSKPLLLHLLEDPRLKSDASSALSILNTSFVNLGDDESLGGVIGFISCDERERVHSCSRRRKHLQAINAIDTVSSVLNATNNENLRSTCHQDVSQVLMNAGLHSLLHSFFKYKDDASTRNVDSAFIDYRYECAWRLGKWEDDDEEDEAAAVCQNGVQKGCSFSRNHFFALKGLLENDSDSFISSSANARWSLAQQLMSGSRESSMAIQKPLANLRLIEELQMFHDQGSVQTLKKDLDDYDRLMKPNSKALVEPLMLQRCIVAQMRINNGALGKSRAQYRELSNQWAMHYVQQCRLHGMNKMAETQLARMAATRRDVNQRFLEAQLLYDADETALAKTIMTDVAADQTLNSDSASKEQRELLVRSLLCLGDWSASLRTENSSAIIKKYYEKAVSNHTSNMESGLRVSAFLGLAHYCDQQHSLVEEQMTSREFEEKQKRVQLMRRDAKAMYSYIQASMTKSDRDALKTTAMLERNSSLDDLELQNLAVERQRYLNTAIVNYGRALAIDHDDHQAGNTESAKTSSEAMLFRLVALWMNNARRHEDINQVVSDLLDKVDSSKFVPLLYQLSARLNANSNHSFEKLLHKLVNRCSKEHILHSLTILLGMSEHNEEDKVAMSGRGIAVRRIIDELKTVTDSNDENLSKSNMSVDKMELLWRCLVKLADHKVEMTSNKITKNPIQMPNDIKNCLQKLKAHGHCIALLSLTPAVRRDRDYRDVVTTSEYKTNFKLVGGITQPKRLECLGSDGKWRPQLLKGNEDVRQDAVMQQVFGLINNCLQQTEATRAQRMHMRTYKVVPLSRKCGLIEWCENTVPLKDYLIGEDGESGAHLRFRPKDYTGKQCRLLMMDADKKCRKQNNRGEGMLKCFEKVCEGFKPVLRYFFFEHFASQSQFYERRLAFIRSTAVSSMVGYIMGLGDRHVQNILLDKFSAEMIHIDLGVAFDQGRILPYPESIPFRLTRDIVDGFGVCGVEYSGFVRCCEDALRALKESRQRIETILDVLVHDPLHDWSVSAQKASRLQKESSKKSRNHANSHAEQPVMSEGERNRLAERVLNRVQQKLSGQELGGVLSTQGQVNALIQQARDPRNLALLFPGWQPYL